MTLLRLTSFSLVALLAACSQTNADHCGNREGDRTCQEQDDGSHPICSSCEASNNGCVAADVEIEESCHAETVADTSTSNGSDPTTSASQSTTTTQTTDPVTTMSTDPVTTMSTSEDASTSDPVTTDPTETTTGETSSSSTMTTDPSESSSTGVESPCGNGAIDDGEQCDAEDLQGETCVSQGLMGGDISCDDQCQLDLTACVAFPSCGDDEINGDEQCDGEMLGVATCQMVNGIYGGGTLACNEGNCTYDTSDCCVAGLNTCNAQTNCCNGACALAVCPL